MAKRFAMTSPTLTTGIDYVSDSRISVQYNRLAYNSLGVERIRRNLNLPDSSDVVDFCRCFILEDFATFERKGKNWYVTAGHVRITVNANSNTIITAHKI